MSQEPIIMRGVLQAFWVSARALTMRLHTESGEPVLVEVNTSRPDFLAQLELAKYALATNEDHEVREANGFETLPLKQVWVRGVLSADAVAPGSTEPGRELRVVRAQALGIGGRAAPFETVRPAPISATSTT